MFSSRSFEAVFANSCQEFPEDAIEIFILSLLIISEDLLRNLNLTLARELLRRGVTGNPARSQVGHVTGLLGKGHSEEDQSDMGDMPEDQPYHTRAWYDHG